MGCWRYCECGQGQSRIDLQDLEGVKYDAFAKVRCVNCDAPRTDDTPEERMCVLIEEIAKLKEEQKRSTHSFGRLVDIVGKISARVVGNDNATRR